MLVCPACGSSRVTIGPTEVETSRVVPNTVNGVLYRDRPVFKTVTSVAVRLVAMCWRCEYVAVLDRHMAAENMPAEGAAS